MQSDEFLVSIIIPNYNYAAFIGAAIESALNVDWRRVEVIVVDDGSTDNSRSVIARYGDRVTTIFQQNSTHRVACNVGFARSQGEVIIFLDSDDMIQPTIIRELAAVWRPGISKVQFQMARIDARGRLTGAVFPQYDVMPTPDEIREWMTKTSAYPTPPSSGNAYARWFLERIFPLDVTCGTFADSACLAAAPFLGDVVTVPKPLVYYRVHGQNDGAFSGLSVERFGREIVRARQQFIFSRRVAASIGIAIPENTIDKSPHYLLYRIASIKLAPSLHPLPGDTVWGTIRDFARAVIAFRGASASARLALFAWAIAVAVTPDRTARRLVLWKFDSASRPRILQDVLAKLRILRRPAGIV
jgi:glycosyltransferase involved in cell wall biosynthesis